MTVAEFAALSKEEQEDYLKKQEERAKQRKLLSWQILKEAEDLEKDQNLNNGDQEIRI